jgi:hypothetical protein
MLHSPYSSSPAAAAVVVFSALVEFIVQLAASLSTGPNACPASVDSLVQIHESFGGRVQKTQAHTTSKRLPLYFYALGQQPLFIIFNFVLLTLLFLVILIENKEKEGFTSPTCGRLGYCSYVQ